MVATIATFFIQRFIFFKKMANEYLKAPHVGELLKKYCDEKRIVKAAWARFQNVEKSTVMRYFNRPGMQLSTMFKISQILKYNFFRHIADMLPADYPPGGTMQQQIDELKKENEKLKDEIAVLKGVIAMKG
jgi:hypothetical protein